MAEYFLAEESPPVDELKAAIRRQTVAREFIPVFMGSAFKNKAHHSRMIWHTLWSDGCRIVAE